MTLKDTAQSFFDACETGKGWDVCKDFAHPDATFSCQSGALADTTSLADYTEWMKGLLTPIPDGRYELTGFAMDEDRGTAIASAVFHGTHSGAGGPVEPTGKTAASDYVYVMRFEGDKISHMTKVWNDAHALQQLGWA